MQTRDNVEGLHNDQAIQIQEKFFYCLNIAFLEKILLLCRLQAITLSFTVHKEMYRIYANWRRGAY